MEKSKRLLIVIPEIYFISLLTLWATYNYFDDLTLINFPAIIGIVILLILLLTKNKFVGVFISSILGMISLYLIPMLIFDFQNMRNFEIIISLLMLIISNVIIASIMFLKHLKSHKCQK
jgi:hypothetical protein